MIQIIQRFVLLFGLLGAGGGLSAPIDFNTFDWKAFGGSALGCDGNVAGLTPLPDGRVLAYGEFRACSSTVLNNVGIWNGSAWEALGTAPHVGTDGAVTLAKFKLDPQNVLEIYLAGQFSSAGNLPVTKWFARYKNNAFESLGAGPDTWGSIVSGNRPPTLSSAAWVTNTIYAFGTFGIYYFDGNQWVFTGSFGSNGTDSGPQQYVFTSQELLVQHDGGGLSRGIGTTWIQPSYPCEFNTFNVDGENFIANAENPTRLVKLRSDAGTQTDHCDDYFPGPSTLLAGLDATKLFYFLSDQDGDWAFGTAGTCLGSGAAVCRRDFAPGSPWVAMPFVATRAEIETLREIARSAPNRWVFIGDAFEFGGVAVDQIFEFSIANGIRPLSSNTRDQGIRGYVNAISLSPDQRSLYVGGRFTRAGVVAANNIAKWDGTRWTAVGTGTENGVNGEVFALLAQNNGVIVGGQFQQAGTQSANSIARFVAAAPVAPQTLGWNAYGSGFFPAVTALRESAQLNALCAGLNLNQSGATTLSAVQCWNPLTTTWSSPSLGPGSGIVGGKVKTISQAGNELWIGGTDLALNGVQVGNLLRLVNASWQTVSGQTPGSPVGVDSSVSGVFAHGASMFVGGEFTAAGGAPIPYFAAYGPNLPPWTSAGANFSLNGPVAAIHGVNTSGGFPSTLCAAGAFTQINALAAGHIVCRDDAGAFQRLGLQSVKGTDTAIAAVAVSAESPVTPLSNRIFIAGDFDFVGGQLSLGMAEFAAPSEILFKDGFESLAP